MTIKATILSQFSVYLRKNELTVIIVETTLKYQLIKKTDELKHETSFTNVFQSLAASNVAPGSVVG
jgi:hypothetical protein